MQFSEIITPELIEPQCGAASFKQVFDAAAEILAPHTGLKPREIMMAFFHRSRLGSSLLGEEGLAAIHAFIRYDGHPVAAAMRLARPLTHCADEKATKFIIAMVFPETAPHTDLFNLHYKFNSLQTAETMAELQAAETRTEIHAVLTRDRPEIND